MLFDYDLFAKNITPLGLLFGGIMKNFIRFEKQEYSSKKVIRHLTEDGEEKTIQYTYVYEYIYVAHYYFGITQGRAKRIARNHRLDFELRRNTGWDGLKLKGVHDKYNKLSYNRLDKKLVIRQNYRLKRLIKKEEINNG